VAHGVNPTVEQLRDRYAYDPETGVVTYRHGLRHRPDYAGREVGSIAPNGYRVARFGPRLYGIHRLIWLMQTGEWPELGIDHINRNKTDNRWSNLRLATKRQNAANSGPLRTSKSGIRGVCYDERLRKWIARGRVNGKSTYFGCYATADEAAQKYREVARMQYGEFAST